MSERELDRYPDEMAALFDRLARCGWITASQLIQTKGYTLATTPKGRARLKTLKSFLDELGDDMTQTEWHCLRYLAARHGDLPPTPGNPPPNPKQ